MIETTLYLTSMANGGDALGRDDNQRIVFVPQAIPGEKVRVEIVEDKERFARGRLLEILEPSTDRITPRCPHFGPCSGCHFQHLTYSSQVRYKEDIVRDQLSRIGGLESPLVHSMPANSEPWEYRLEMSFSPTKEGGLGLWSSPLGRVMAIDICHIIKPRLKELLEDVDLDMPNLKKLKLRVGKGDTLLAALEANIDDPPELTADFPVSVSLLLPEGTAVNLVGENHLIQTLKGRDFHVTAGCFFYSSLPALELLVDTVLRYTGPKKAENLLELFSGVGTLTAFLANHAVNLVAIELNPDAIEDAAVNLNDYNNITLYEGPVEEILPLIEVEPQVMVIDPPRVGLPPKIIDEISLKRPDRLIYVSSDAAIFARDAKRLVAKGYHLTEVQPIDMYPQTYQILSVSLFRLLD
jgi:23S rRNA (uracil1939-C5)-methyltransferase